MRAIRVLVLASVVVAGCTKDRGDDDNGRRNLLTPQFLPTTSTTAPSETSAVPGDPGSTLTPPGTPAGAGTVASAPAVVGASTAAVVDRAGDLTPSPLDPPPPWADLVGGTLIRRADGFELRVRLGGSAAPTGTDENHTMNVASFYDLDGDGRIDYEVWANLAAGGWGPSYFDNTRQGRNEFGDSSGVSVAVEGPELVLRFPVGHLGGAASLRWALASEWGRYEVLGTAAMARDDAPDNDAAAAFPG